MSLPTPRSLLTLARSELRDALVRVARLPWPGPVQRYAQDTLGRALRYFPVLAELLGWPAQRVPAPAAQPAPAQPAAQPPSAPARPADSGATNGGGSRPALDVDAALAALRGPSAEAAASAAETLAACVDPRARAALLEVVYNLDGYFHPLPRVAALRALARERSEPALRAIVAAVDSVSAEVSLAAIGALVESAPEHALAPIRRVVEDPSNYFAAEVRAAAERALARLSARTGAPS